MTPDQSHGTTEQEDPLVLRGEHRVDVDDGNYGMRTDFLFAESNDSDAEHMSVGVGGAIDGISIDVSYDHDDEHFGALATLTPEKARRVARALNELADYQEGDSE